MQKKMIVTTTQDDLNLIVLALSAYQHNTRYQALYEQLTDLLRKPDGDIKRPWLLS